MDVLFNSWTLKRADQLDGQDAS